MDMELNSQIVQAQKTIIIQKLIQQMEILQMPSFDLSQHIQEMLAVNPLLEHYTPENDDYYKEFEDRFIQIHAERINNNSQKESHEGDISGKLYVVFIFYHNLFLRCK